MHNTTGRAGGTWEPECTATANGHPQAHQEHPALHYAQYIGRVGVLAAALGVGAALTGAPGVAWAEPAGTDTSSSSSAEATETRAGAEDASETDSRTTAQTPESETPSRSETSTAEMDDAADEEAPPEETLTSEPTPVETATLPTPAGVEPEVAAETPTTPAENETPTAPAEVEIPVADAPRQGVESRGTATEDTAPPSVATDKPDVATANLSTEQAMLIPAALDEQPRIAGPEITSTQVGPAPAASSIESAPPIAPVQAPTAATRLLTAITPAIAPASPAVQAAQTPLLWGIFAWTRRTFFNATPVVTYDGTTTSRIDNTIVGRVTASDADAGTLTLTASAPTGGGTVVVRPDGTFTYTVPATGFTNGGTDSFTITATDSHDPAHIHGLAGLLNRVSFGLLGSPGHTATTRVVLSIAAATPPVLGTPAVSLSPVQHSTGAVSGALHATDSDTLTYTLTGGPVDGDVTLDAATGAFTYTPTSVARHQASAENATPEQLADTFTITVDDSHGGTISVPVAVTIDPSNSPPTITLVASDPDGAGTIHVTVTVTDPDNDATTYFVVADPAYGTLTPTPDGYDYTPAADRLPTGADTATLTGTASDLHHSTDTQTVTVTTSPATPAATTALSSANIRLPAVATVVTLSGWSFPTWLDLSWLHLPNISQQFGGRFAQAPYTMAPLTYPTSSGISSIRDGVKMLDAKLMSTSGDIIVEGHSLGAQICSRWMRQYAADPVRAALASRVTFPLTGNPLRSSQGGGGKAIGMLEADGAVGRPTPTTTPWSIIDVARRWDGWADWPADTTNALAVRNATAGINYFHSRYDVVDLYDAQNTVWRDRNTTYVLTHEDHSPLLKSWLGVPYTVESVVRSQVEAGYTRPSSDIPVPVRPTQSMLWQAILQWMKIPNTA